MSISRCEISYNYFHKIYVGDNVRLKDLREDSDLTQQAIANLLNIKQNTYCQYEKGMRQIPIELLVRLAKYYGVSVDYILNLTDIKEPYPKK